MSIFVSVDSLAEEFFDYCGYVYTMNSSINLVDSTGMASKGRIFHFIIEERETNNILGMRNTGKGNGEYNQVTHFNNVD